MLAFDFGMRRIGVAVGELSMRMAHPLATIAAASNEQRFAEITALVEEWKPVLLVVGLPAHADGGEHEMATACRRFAARLQGRFKLDAILVDEQFTSASASSALHESGVTGRKQKPLLDQMAAQQILQSYFNELARNS